MVASFLATPFLIRMISLRSSLEKVPRIKILVKMQGENPFQSSRAGSKDSLNPASFRLGMLLLDECSDNVSWFTAEEGRQLVERNERWRDSFSISV